jgi:sn-glycerol 3-phosphate transport system substrate-binding protein
MFGRPTQVCSLWLCLLLVAGCAPAATPAPTAGPKPADAQPTTAAAKPAESKPAAGAGVTELTFFYPVAVGGPITRVVDGYVEEFNNANPDVKVASVFAGSYADTLTKIQTALQGGGNPPQVAVLLSTDLHTLVDAETIIPLDDLLKQAGDAYLADFFEAFMLNSRYQGKVWGVPFQRSTPVLYYNKDHFREVGLDPERAPQSWAEQIEYAAKLTRPDGQRWGLAIPSDGFPYWLFQGLAIGNGKNVVGDAANEVFFNDPTVVEALQAQVDAAKVHKVMPEGIVQWATTPTDFTAGKASMIWHTTGSLTNILREAKFPVGVGFLPGLKQNGAPTGGGNLYIFQKSSDAEKAAAWKFIQFMTTPERAAQWSVDTGYVATRKSSYDTPSLKEYATQTPQALVARDQLQFAGKELGTHSGPQVQKILSDGVQAALLGQKSPKQALDDAQREAERILRQFKD